MKVRPVGRKKDYRTASKEAYGKFCKENPDVHISCADYRQVIRLFNRGLMEHILETGEKTKVSILGSFCIQKKKTRKFVEIGGEQYVALPIDWKRSKELGKRVYILNTHSDGYRYSWMWFRNDARFKSSDIWWFRPARPNSRAITQYVNRGIDFCTRYREWSRSKD